MYRCKMFVGNYFIEVSVDEITFVFYLTEICFD